MWILGLKGYKTSPTPTTHLTGRTASERNEGKTFVRRRYVLCANFNIRSSEFDSFNLHTSIAMFHLLFMLKK